MPFPLAAFAAGSLARPAFGVGRRLARRTFGRSGFRRGVAGGAGFAGAEFAGSRLLRGGGGGGGGGSAMGALVGGQIIGQEPGVIIVRTPRGNILRIKRRKKRRQPRQRRGDRGLTDKDIERVLLLSRAMDGGS